MIFKGWTFDFSYFTYYFQPLSIVRGHTTSKHIYESLVEKSMSCSINHIDKQNFLSLYQQAHPQALHSNNIWSDFAATGLVPFNPDYILLNINAQYHTSSPLQLHLQTQTVWTAEMPYNINKLEQQTKLIKEYLKHHTQSLPSPTEQVLNQLVKSCWMVMHNVVLFASQNEQLSAENQHQKQKWT